MIFLKMIHSDVAISVYFEKADTKAVPTMPLGVLVANWCEAMNKTRLSNGEWLGGGGFAVFCVIIMLI